MSADSDGETEGGRGGNAGHPQGNNNNGNPPDANGAGGQGAVNGGAADGGQNGHPAAPAADTAPAATGDEQNVAPGAGAAAGAQIPDVGGAGGAQIPANDGAAVMGGNSARDDHLDTKTTMTKRSQRARFAQTAAVMQPVPNIVWRTAPDHGDTDPGTKNSQTLFMEITKRLPHDQRLDPTRSNGPLIHEYLRARESNFRAVIDTPIQWFTDGNVYRTTNLLQQHNWFIFCQHPFPRNGPGGQGPFSSASQQSTITLSSTPLRISCFLMTWMICLWTRICLPT